MSSFAQITSFESIPSEILSEIEGLREKTITNSDLAEGSCNYEGEPWIEESLKKGITVWSSKSKITKARHFRVSMVIDVENISVEQIYDNISRYELRKKWDSVLNQPRTVRTYVREDGNATDVVRYMTKEAAGGLISPRVFTDIRMFFGNVGDSSSIIGGSIALKQELFKHIHSNAAHEGSGDSITSFNSAVKYTPAEEKCTVAENLPGGGLRVDIIDEKTATGKMRVRLTMSSHTKLGGWLPQALVNSSTGNAMAGIFENYVANFASFSDGAKCEIVFNL